MDSSKLKIEVEEIIKEELRPLAEAGEVKTEASPSVSLAIVRGKKLEPVKFEPEDKGLASCPLAHDPEAQLAALAPVAEEEEEDPEEPAASQAPQVASISVAVPFKREEREPAPPGEDTEDDPFALGPRRSRSPPASRAQLRSLSATASQKPRKKTSFYPLR